MLIKSLPNPKISKLPKEKAPIIRPINVAAAIKISNAPISFAKTLNKVINIVPRVSNISCNPDLVLLPTFFLKSEFFTFSVTSFTPSFTRDVTS